MRPAWLDAAELRIGLGCMRLSTDDGRDEVLALETIAAAAEAGVTVFDTAHAYGRGADELGHNEKLLARALRASGAADRARVVTKGGMRRAGGGWIPDGRAKAILADCEGSLVALDGLAIDLYLLHTPDPRTPWETSVRALARLDNQGLVRRVGLSNVNRGQLEEALVLADIAAVQVALSPYDVRALRGGVVELCEQRGVSVIAHSPLGGPRRAAGLARHQALADIARANDVTPGEVALAWLLGLSPALVAIPGARSPESVRSAVRAAELRLGAHDRAVLARSLGKPVQRRPKARLLPIDAEVVLLMGIPGAGKSRLAEDYAARGYVRLNRDDLGGSLRKLAETLDSNLSSGVRRIVLDNTYLTRAARSYVIETAGLHRVPTRCVWLDTPLAQAQVNLVARLLGRVGSLPSPEELRRLARSEPGMLLPTSQMRALRELEEPSLDEGFARVERIPFTRRPNPRGQLGVLVAAPALRHPGWREAIEKGDPPAPHLLFDWSPDGPPDALAGAVERLSEKVKGPIDSALCPHPAGPPTCWCRPPLPGLPLAFAQLRGVDLSRSILVGAAPAHRTLATTLGARYVPT